ncbi:MAG: DUF3365 domain-containing protein [Flavobacteriales bacterium]|nr:DUF3365 domain-containing protein [Flavobacteriales bacterium]
MKALSSIVILLTAALLLQCGQDTPVEQTEVVTDVQEQILDTAYYLATGQEVAQATFAALSGKLQQAIADGGVENALKFCSANALPLTDSLAQQYNVIIKRTSHKVRNLKNAPNAEEASIIDRYLTGENKPVIRMNDTGEAIFYAPIMTKGLCLICHGEVGKTISPADSETIASLYLEDQAINFSEGDLRGMWSITFKNNDHE